MKHVIVRACPSILLVLLCAGASGSTEDAIKARALEILTDLNALSDSGIQLSHRSVELRGSEISYWSIDSGKNSLILTDDGRLRVFERDKSLKVAASAQVRSNSALEEIALNMRSKLFSKNSFGKPLVNVNDANASADLDYKYTISWSAVFGDDVSETSLNMTLDRRSGLVSWISSDIDFAPGPRNVGLTPDEARERARGFIRDAIAAKEIDSLVGNRALDEVRQTVPTTLFAKPGGAWGNFQTQRYADIRQLRFAYIFRLADGFITVDTSTGELIGGSLSRAAGRSRARKLDLNLRSSAILGGLLGKHVTHSFE